MKSFHPLMKLLVQNRIIRSSARISTSAVLFFMLLFAGTGFAQTGIIYTTVGQSKLVCTRGNDACPANDLQVKDLFIDGVDQCLNCTTGDPVTKDLYMVIDNTTGSVRTAFALFGTLSTGSSINGFSGKIFICVGEITVLKGLNKFKVGQITFICGQQVTLTDNYLAYTPASGSTEDVCAKFAQATSCKDISPKCGVAASITVRTPATIALSDENDPCRNAVTPDGKIKITPSGGTAPYGIVVFKSANTTCPTIPPIGTPVVNQTGVGVSGYTATGLAAGTYCVYCTDANGCKVPVKSITIGKDCCTPPGAPTVCQVPADLCGDGKVVLKVSGTVKDAVYHCKQGGNEVAGSPLTASADNAELQFKVVPGGGNIEVYGVSSVNGTTCTGTSTTSDCAKAPNGIGVCTSGNIAEVSKIKPTDQEIVLNKPSRQHVLAAPNPFNDRIRFTLKSDVSGNGSLELFNTLGQKVKTVYQGQVTAGQMQTIEYTVPGPQRSNLIYVFRVGKEQTTGKLIGPK